MPPGDMRSGMKFTPVMIFATHTKKMTTSIGITQDVTIITASVSTKRFSVFAAFSVRLEAVSDMPFRIDWTRPLLSPASVSSIVSSAIYSAVLMVLFIESSKVV